MCAYFNNSFTKVFLGNSTNPSADLDEGFLNVDGVLSVNLKSTYGVGVYGLFYTDSSVTGGNKSVNAASSQVTSGKPLTLMSSALMQSDKIGPFHGGYQETNKSKLINPKYVSKFYRVDPCLPNPNVIHVGQTAFTEAESPAPTGCCHDFECNKTYYLRVDVKGSPALRYLTRNAYWTADAYTGCCDDPANPNIVDPTTVMIQWATGLLGQGVLGSENFIPNKIVGPFIAITIYDFLGKAWYQPGTNNGVDEWDSYSPATAFDPDTHACADGYGAGMKIQGAYVDTEFGDCTFYPSDFFQKEPVHIYASEVDQLGDPCVFTGICVVEQCCPRQGMGFGEQVLRDLILSESYLQNYFNTNLDLRIREVTQGYDISSAVDRRAFYYRYFILHSVPRFNNPTGVFDNDQYMLEVITNGVSTSFQTTMSTWLSACGCGVALETQSCDSACPCTTPIVLNGSFQFLTITRGSSVNRATYAGGGCGENTVFSLTGSLPPGLSLNESTGGITGTIPAGFANVPSQFNFTVTASDNCSCVTSQSYSWVITTA